MTSKIVPFGENGYAIICIRGPKPKTWKCECGKRTPNAAVVCQHCGLYRDGCPKCDADVLPVDSEPFERGKQRQHKCKACDWQVTA